KREIGPRPFAEHGDAIAEPDQPKDVEEYPEEPAEKTGQLNPSDHADGAAAADHRHRSVVAIPKRLERAVRERPPDVSRGVRAFLLGNLRNAGQQLTVLLQRADVAHDEDLGPPGHSDC